MTSSDRVSKRVAVLVPGLWLSGWAMAAVEHWIGQSGRQVRVFSYRSVGHDAEWNADSLRRFIGETEAANMDFVGHSLGGLILLTMLQARDDFPPGRVVLLGSPLRGSSVSRSLSAWPMARPLLGHSAPILNRGIQKWTGPREVGVIAGRLPLGLGRLIPGLPAPSDGTVAVEETCLPGLTGHITIPVTHTGLLFSHHAARETVHFLDTGRFSA